jgi:hypothetical protein
MVTTAERAPAGDIAVPKVVITMPAYRAELTLAKTVADIPRDVAALLILVDDASPTTRPRSRESSGSTSTSIPRTAATVGTRRPATRRR